MKMKYVIWGCGLKGQHVIDMLRGTQSIVAIVESNRELQGTMFQGIPIVSFDEFLLSYSAYPVIVTPSCHEDEIMKQLKLNNIIVAFPYPKEWAQVEALLVRFPINETLKRYHDNKNLAIYGVSLLGLILYDLFLENGFEVSLMIPSHADLSLKQYVRETLKLKTVSVDDINKDMKLLLAAELEGTDQNKLHGVEHEKYYDLHLRKDLFYNPELEKFRDIHKGKRCFIVATGPSLRIDDLDILYHNGGICISVNGIFRAFAQTKWRPDYYVISDLKAGHTWKNEILAFHTQAKFIADHVYCFNDKHYDNIYSWHLIRETNDHGVPAFSDDFARGAHWGHTVIYDGAMQLAVYMGFKEIYLLGTDCTVYSDGRVPHFGDDISEYESGLQARLWQKKITCAYHVAKQYADSHGIKIYNATRGGELEVFPRVDFDSLFS